MKLDKVIAVRTDKTIYRDGEHAIKLFDSDYSKSDILNEALNQSRVEETGLPIPKIEEVTKINGKWAVITEYIEGKTLERLMEEEPENKAGYMDQFLDIQIMMHEKKSFLLNKLYDKFERKIQMTDLDASVKYDLHTRLAAMPRHSKLCHGDFNPSNIIMNPDRGPYILDWSHAAQGNASADAARTYLLFWLNGQIGLADDYLALFCLKSGNKKAYVQSWLPIVAAAQLAKGKPAEREFLLHWINVVDYE